LNVHDVRCPLCGGERYSTVFRDSRAEALSDPTSVSCTSLDHGAFGRIVDCVDCGLRFRSPREDDATIALLYERVEDTVYLEHERARRLTFARAADGLARIVPTRGPLLEVGCYTGVFLDVAATRGWDVVGVEPSAWAAEIARNRGHEVHTGTIDTVRLPEGRFAVVALWDVLEHLGDPVRELRAAWRLARDDGWLVLSTVRIDSWPARLLRARWPWYMRMHLCYFTRATLARTLAHAGWQVVAMHGYPHVVTWDYLLLKLGRWVPTRALRAGLRRLGLSERTVVIDLGDFVTAYATKLPPGVRR
jgi:2-polyprenyl-3-methyl-5-hydroxy-6-metoxy-1,4-benzoquinol methylase